MRVLKFTLCGKTAFFKKPEVNSYLYFTYGNIHKVALLGIFGAILGYGGYNQQKAGVYPEFYEKLKDIKLSIVPNNPKGFIPKKVQTFNNSVGYASKELGGNLIVKEQWLENPSWDIYLLVRDDESRKISEYIIDKKAIYAPYLGKNDHYANITEVEVIDNVNEIQDIDSIDCLCLKNCFEFSIPDEEAFSLEDTYVDYYKYEEQLPYGLDKENNMYMLKPFVFTNMNATLTEEVKIYKVEEKNIVFY
jgi:CRISPR-associated protein Cas5h